MSLAQVQFPAPTPQGLVEWSHAHFQHHLAIITAMQETRAIALPRRMIFPVNFDDPASVQIFLQEHQLMHSEFQAALGIQSNDLANVDFGDADQRDAWMFLNLQAHRSAAEALGLDIL